MKYTSYDEIGTSYNQTRQADPYLAGRLLELLNPKLSKEYLDIGCGTGNYTNEVARQGFSIMGIDPSRIMLMVARSNYPYIDFKLGKAEETGLNSNHFDGIICFLTTHHWSDMKKGFIELKRLIKDGGRIVIFTSLPEQTGRYWLTHYFPKMIQKSAELMPTMKTYEYLISEVGLSISRTEKYYVKDDLKDKFLYYGKHKPTVYFDEKLRSGISSFAAVANKEEVEKGLVQLKKDIDLGKINAVIKKYEHNAGDYLFIVVE